MEIFCMTILTLLGKNKMQREVCYRTHNIRFPNLINWLWTWLTKISKKVIKKLLIDISYSNRKSIKIAWILKHRIITQTLLTVKISSPSTKIIAIVIQINSLVWLILLLKTIKKKSKNYINKRLIYKEI